MMIPMIAAAALVPTGLAAAISVWVLGKRVVVPANEVHTLQRSKSQLSYGKDQDGGNTYYNWPTWIPGLGLTRIILPVSVFDLSLHAYEAYDKERVPFVVDVTAFFRINESNVAAQRVSSFNELREQLTSVVQGAVRTILAQHEIDQIMVDRATFGEQFTAEVGEQLKSWGVEPVKNIELMDIRDAKDSKVIYNIMSKRTSAIEKDSRIAVAENTQLAKTKEIEAARTIKLADEQAQQAIGEREAERQKAVALAQESSQQEVLEQQRETTLRTMAVREVETTRQAEIDRIAATVRANQEKDVAIVRAEGEKSQQLIAAEAQKQKTVLLAEADLEAQRRAAEGALAQGQAKAESEKLLLMAPVEAQVTLAKEIGENQGYQTYLLQMRQIEANQAIGVEGAGALKNAQIKVISNAGDPQSGISNVLDMFGPKGGTAIAGLLEAVAQSDEGQKVINKLTDTTKSTVVNNTKTK